MPYVFFTISTWSRSPVCDIYGERPKSAGQARDVTTYLASDSPWHATVGEVYGAGPILQFLARDTACHASAVHVRSLRATAATYRSNKPRSVGEPVAGRCIPPTRSAVSAADAVARGQYDASIPEDTADSTGVRGNTIRRSNAITLGDATERGCTAPCNDSTDRLGSTSVDGTATRLGITRMGPFGATTALAFVTVSGSDTVLVSN
jgi:hypothetical protein